MSTPPQVCLNQEESRDTPKLQFTCGVNYRTPVTVTLVSTSMTLQTRSLVIDLDVGQLYNTTPIYRRLQTLIGYCRRLQQGAGRRKSHQCPNMINKPQSIDLESTLS